MADLDDTHLFSLSNVLTRSQLNVGLHSLAVQEDLSHWPHLRDLLIPNVNIDDVHLLIGQDAPDIMIPTDVGAGLKGEPYATTTALGWTLNGPITHHKRPKSSSSYFVKLDMDLQHQVEKLWRIDDVHNVGSDNETMSVSHNKVLSIWENLLHRDGVNYTMDIPFKDRPPHLLDDRSMAEHRLRFWVNGSPRTHHSRRSIPVAYMICLRKDMLSQFLQGTSTERMAAPGTSHITQW